MGREAEVGSLLPGGGKRVWCYLADIPQGGQGSSPTFQLVQITVTSNRLSLECGSIGVDFWAQRKRYIRILDEADGKQRSRIPSLIGKKENQKCPSVWGSCLWTRLARVGVRSASQMVKLG